nr:hypothetical protein JVH1_8733 [Rhodococcus sp. JVH1]
MGTGRLVDRDIGLQLETYVTRVMMSTGMLMCRLWASTIMLT